MSWMPATVKWADFCQDFLLKFWCVKEGVNSGNSGNIAHMFWMHLGGGPFSNRYLFCTNINWKLELPPLPIQQVRFPEKLFQNGRLTPCFDVKNVLFWGPTIWGLFRHFWEIPRWLGHPRKRLGEQGNSAKKHEIYRHPDWGARYLNRVGFWNFVIFVIFDIFAIWGMWNLGFSNVRD